VFVVYLKTMSKYQKDKCSWKNVKGSSRALADSIFCNLSREAEVSRVNSQDENRTEISRMQL